MLFAAQGVDITPRSIHGQRFVGIIMHSSALLNAAFSSHHDHGY